MKTKKAKMFILIVVDKNEKESYFGPFDDGEKALDWGLDNFDESCFLISTTLYDPKKHKKK